MRIMIDSNIYDELIADPISLNKVKTLQSHGLFLTNKSLLGRALLGTGENGQISYNKIKKNNKNHVEDAIIATAAGDVADVFVSNDKKLRNKMLLQESALKILDYTDFAELIKNW